MAYGTRVMVGQRWDDVVDQVAAALAEQDFVVLAELDLREVMQAKLGVEMPDQRVLGVCRRPLADAALRAEPSLGLLLPVHVVVRAESPEVTVVEAADPVMMVAITGNPALEPLVQDIAERLAAALHSLPGRL
jgi:uncharacterized protein (DUF302 family)